MSEGENNFRAPNPYIAWLGCLYFLIQKTRKSGLISIECDIENPKASTSTFQLFPQTLNHPYIDFAGDVLRFMVSGNINTDDLQIYADNYIAGLIAQNSELPSEKRVNENLLRTIWFALWAAMKGYPPLTACEFGRQAIPFQDKVSFNELEHLLFNLDAHFCFRHKGGLDAAIDEFIATLG